LPQVLPTLSVGTPAIRIFIEIFISKHRLKGSPSMVEIEHIFDQEPLGRQVGDEKFVDPLPNALADRNLLA
jgi:hypothetical protein